ncbi:MAG TPA: hypothetical protein VE962_07305 [Actinomycetota bacterium]|nr:hypothetical protein [Actinomycetota bacterium]
MSGWPTAVPAPRCTECGTPLASRMLPDGIVVIGDLRVPFRRATDFVVCERCMTTFWSRDVRDGMLRPV